MKSQQKDEASWKCIFQGNILALGLVSFFTDLSSEMIYPLLPAFFSGLAATLSLWRLVREAPRSTGTQAAALRRSPPGRPGLPSRFYLFLLAIALFTLGNSSDLFLIFYAQDRFGLGLGWVIGLWVGLHFAKIIFSLPGGWLADQFGRSAAILAGWFIYAAVYTIMPFTSNLGAAGALLLLYGAYFGMTEGAERALVADFATVGDRGRAYGLYHGTIGFATVPASLIFGVFWARLGPKTAFLIGAALAAGALLLMACCLRRSPE